MIHLLIHRKRGRVLVRRSIATVRVLLVCFLALWPLGLLAQEAEPAPPTTSSVIALAVAPGDSRVVLAGTLNTPQLSSVYRSQDGGVTWSGPASGLRSDISIAAVTFDVANPQVVLAADGGFGYLFRSTDGGLTWQELPDVKQNLIGPNSAVGELYAYSQDGRSVMHAGTRFDGVLTSQDGGQTWQANDLGLQGSARRVRAVRLFNGSLYAGTHDGLYRQAAGSNEWQRIGPFPAESILFSLAVHQGGLYAGTAGIGVWRSADGETWQELAGFPADVSVYDLTSTGDSLVAATSYGIWAGSGELWQIASVDDAEFTESVFSLASGPGTVYAGTSTRWVLRSDDGGQRFYSLATLVPLTASGPAPTPAPALPAATPTAVAEEPAAVESPEVVSETTAVDATVPITGSEPVTGTATLPEAPSPTPPPPTFTPAPPTATPAPPPTDTPAAEVAADAGAEGSGGTPVAEAPVGDAPAAPEAPAEGEGSLPAAAVTEITQLPPMVVGVAVVLVIVVLVAGLSVLRGPREL